MFENIGSFFRRIVKPEQKELGSKDAAKERLHLVLMQDRANVSSEFLELMKQEILDVIKKYIIVDESQIDVRLTNQQNEDGTNGAPSLYANIPIVNIKNEMLVGKVKEFDSKTNSINFGEYKMVIETVSNADGENEDTDVTEEEKQEAVEEIKEEIKEKIEEVKEALAEEKNLKETEQDDVKEDTIETEEIDSDIEQPVLIFNDNDNDSEEKDKTVEVEEVKEEIIEKTESEETETDESEENKDVLNVIDDLDDEEDDDDDVTFDDLLKAAEEEDRLLEEQAKKKDELDLVKVKHNNRNQTNKHKNNKRKGKK